MRNIEIQTKTIAYSTTVAATLMVVLGTVSLSVTAGMLALFAGLELEKGKPTAAPTGGGVQVAVCPEIGTPVLGYKKIFSVSPLKIDALGKKLNEHGKNLAVLTPQEKLKDFLFANNFLFLDSKAKSALTSDLKSFKQEYVSMLRSGKFDEVKKTHQNLRAARWLLASSQNCVPELVSEIEGEIQIVHADNFEGKTSETRIYLEDSKTKKRHILYLEKPDARLESGTRVRLKDVTKLDRDIFIEKKFSRVEILSAPEPANPPVTGPYRVIAAYVQPQEMPGPVIDRNSMAGGFNTLSEFYKINSFNKAWLTGATGDNISLDDIYPKGGGAYKVSLPYRCSEDENTICNPNDINSCSGRGKCVISCDALDISRAVIRASDAEIVFSDRARLVAFIPKEMNCPYAGIAAMGMTRMRTNDSADEMRMGIASIVAQNSDFTKLQSTVAHELGHTFFMNHAMFGYCEQEGQRPEECKLEEYGDPFDVLALANLYHHNAVIKDWWQWLEPSATAAHRVAEVTPQNQNETFYLSPYEKLEGGLKAIKIPHGFKDSSPHLYVEWRQPMNLDAEIQKKGVLLGFEYNIFKGALLHTGPVGSWFTLLFDAKLSQFQNIHPALEYNSEYIDPGTGSIVKLGEPNAEGLLPVNVKLGRYDFTGPVNLRMESQETPDECKRTYKFFADDESGISKIRVYVTDSITNFNVPNAVVDLTQEPYTLDVDLKKYARGYIWLEAYDKASLQGGNLADNSSLGPRENIPLGCDITPPEITLISPEHLKNYPEGPVRFKIHVEDSQSTLNSININVESKDGKAPLPRMFLYTYVNFGSEKQEKAIDIDVIREFPAGQYIIGLNATDIHFDGGVTNQSASRELFINVGKECSNRVDDDGDKKVDFPEDSGCADAGDISEKDDCEDGFDNDYDGFIDFLDISCAPDQVKSEKSNIFECDNGVDDDFDGNLDYLEGFGVLGGLARDGFHEPDCVSPSGFEKNIFELKGHEVISKNANEIISLYAYDLDGDGEKEIILLTSNSVYAYGKNQETGNYNKKKYQYTASELNWPIAIGDIDNDGKTEILVGDKSLKQLLVLKTIPGVLDMQKFIEYPLSSSYPIFILGDINNDGSFDIPVAYKESSPPHIDFLSYDKDAPNKFKKIFQFNSISKFGFIPLHTDRYALGDVTGDGADDLVMANTVNSEVVVISYDSVNPEGSSKSFFSISWPYEVNGPVLGDIDGDGLNEVILGNSTFISAFRKGRIVGNEVETVFRYNIAQDNYWDGFTASLDYKRGLLLADIDFDNLPEIFAVVKYKGDPRDVDSARDLLIITRNKLNSSLGERYAVARDVEGLGPVLDVNLDSKYDMPAYFNYYALLSERDHWVSSLYKFRSAGFEFPLAQDLDNNGKIELVFAIDKENEDDLLRMVSGFEVYESIFKSDKIQWPMEFFDARNTRNFGTLVKSQDVRFKRGDVDQDGVLKITDPILILDYLFIGRAGDLLCQDSADVDDDGAINISDAIYLLDYMFLGTKPALPEPFEECGIDLTSKDNLGCASFPLCAR